MTTPKETATPRTPSEAKPKTVQDVYEAALQLNSDERELLIAMLDQDQDENSGWASPEIKQAWMDEIERRERLHAEGKNPNLSLDEAREQVLAHLDRLQQ